MVMVSESKNQRYIKGASTNHFAAVSVIVTLGRGVKVVTLSYRIRAAWNTIQVVILAGIEFGDFAPNWAFKNIGGI